MEIQTVKNKYASNWYNIINSLLVKLIPAKVPRFPKVEDHTKYSDCICISVYSELNFRDRLRVLFTGKYMTYVRTLTENKPGEVVSEATSFPTFLSKDVFI